MNVDVILDACHREQVDYVLIGGMNFLLRHRSEPTFGVDLWVRDASANLERLNRALRRLGAVWGPTEAAWNSVPDDWHWLERQAFFCLTTEHGAVDIFRDVRGLEGRYDECRARAVPANTASGIKFLGLSDQDMLTCQEALPPGQRHERRMAVLHEALRHSLHARE